MATRWLMAMLSLTTIALVFLSRLNSHPTNPNTYVKAGLKHVVLKVPEFSSKMLINDSTVHSFEMAMNN